MSMKTDVALKHLTHRVTALEARLAEIEEKIAAAEKPNNMQPPGTRETLTAKAKGFLRP